jgi:predicted SAM-dependent methyltransferase
VEYVQTELGIPCVCTDIAGLSKEFPKASFHLIRAFYLLDRVWDVDEMLRSRHAPLKQRGWLVIAVPLANSVQARIFDARWVSITEAPRHVSIPTQLGVKRALERIGFTEISSSYDSALMAAG